MAGSKTEGALAEALYKNIGSFNDFVSRYYGNADYRRRVDADPVAALRENGIDLPGGVEIQVRVNTDDTFYLVMPPDPNTELDDETMAAIAGGGGTIGTLTSLGSFSCPLASFASLVTVKPLQQH